MPDDAQATALFDRVTAIFAPYRSSLTAKTDEPGDLSLETPPSPAYPSGLFFGAVKIGRRYVSFQLMPVYVHPDLLDGMIRNPGVDYRDDATDDDCPAPES